MKAFFFLAVLLLPLVFGIYQTRQELEDSDPFALHMFENFQLCREVFVREMGFYKDLLDAKEGLEEKLEAARSASQTQPRGQHAEAQVQVLRAEQDLAHRTRSVLR